MEAVAPRPASLFEVIDEVSGADGRVLAARTADADVVAYPRVSATIKALRAGLLERPEVAEARMVESGVAVRFTDEAIDAAGRTLTRVGGIPAPPQTVPRAVVTFCDPNANKALHLGHVRNIAVGEAHASLLERAGVAVTRQSIICDIGRAMAEAMAGYVLYREADSPCEAGRATDEFVGRCYAAYAQAHGSDRVDPDADSDPQAQDAPAERMLQDLLVGKPEAVELWERLRRWVLVGHDETLERLGVRIARPVYESDAMGLFPAVLDEALAAGLFVRIDDGSVHLNTGRAELPQIPMLRANGFPTEYLRQFATWHWLQGITEAPTACVNVMGMEWMLSTDIREDVLPTLVRCPLLDAYRRIGVAMVKVQGRVMKSREGDAPLVYHELDHLADEIARRGLADHAPADHVAAVVLKSFFLNVAATRPIEYTAAKVESPTVNPGWTLVQAWASSFGNLDDPAGDSEESSYRRAVIAAHELGRMWQAVLNGADIRVLTRHVYHLAAGMLQRAPVSAAAAAVTARTLREALASMGLRLPADRSPMVV